MARNRGLDSLRGLAILLVLGVHVQASPTWAKVGWLGVDLFFVLSGFLISNLLFSEYKTHGSINLKSFYIRRGFKLYPSFYFLVLATILYCWIAGRGIRLGTALAEVTFMQNYFTGLWGHTWSLAVEEHFYILLPLSLVCMARFARGGKPFRGTPVLFLVVALTSKGRICDSIHCCSECCSPIILISNRREYRNGPASTASGFSLAASSPSCPA